MVPHGLRAMYSGAAHESEALQWGTAHGYEGPTLGLPTGLRGLYTAVHEAEGRTVGQPTGLRALQWGSLGV